MNQFSITKLLTVVCFILINTSLAWADKDDAVEEAEARRAAQKAETTATSTTSSSTPAASTTTKDKPAKTSGSNNGKGTTTPKPTKPPTTKEECVTSTASASKTYDSKKSLIDTKCGTYTLPADKIKCHTDEGLDALGVRPDSSICDDLPSTKDCDSANSKLSSTLDDKDEACEVYGKAGSTDCMENIKKCLNISSQIASPDKNDSMQGIATAITGLMASRNNSQAGGSSQDNSCFTPLSKDKKDFLKDQADLKKDLAKDNNDLKDKSAEESKKLKEKEAEVAKKLQELQDELAKQKNKLDAEMREKLSQQAKAAVNAGTRRRQLEEQTRKDQSEIVKLKHQYNIAMLEFAQDKLDFKCKSAIEQAKAKALEEGKKAKKRGTKATGELKKYLTVVRDACYENEDVRKRQAAFDLDQKIKDINAKIGENQKAIEDLIKNITLDEENVGKIQEETNKEKATAEESVQKKVEAYNKEVAELKSLTEKQIADFTDRMSENTKRTNERISELMTNMKEVGTAKAEKAARAALRAEKAVTGACCGSSGPIDDKYKHIACPGGSSQPNGGSSNMGQSK